MTESIEIHNELNPKLFANDRLKPEVRDRLVSIADYFNSTLDIPLDIIDLQLVGSNASYNYTEHSDIDLHIIVSFDTMDIDREVLQSLYNLEKSQFNREYDITIKGLEVEVYVDDVNSGVQSNGIYSIAEDAWVKYPKKLTNIPDVDVSKEFNANRSDIEHLLLNGNFDDIKQKINTLYLIRKNSLAVDGEYGRGNQLFKEIRNAGLLDALKERMKEVKSDDLTLESLSLNKFLFS